MVRNRRGLVGPAPDHDKARMLSGFSGHGLKMSAALEQNWRARYPEGLNSRHAQLATYLADTHARYIVDTLSDHRVP